MLIPGCPACAGRGSKSAYHNQYIIKSALCTGLHFQIERNFPILRLRGGRSCADSGRALPCTRAYAASTRGLCPLDSRPSPGRRPTRTAAGRCPAPAPLQRAPEGSALCLDSRPSPGRRPTRTAAGRYPAPAPLRRAPEGAALWTPAGVITPDPEMLRISPRLRAGRGFGAFLLVLLC